MTASDVLPVATPRQVRRAAAGLLRRHLRLALPALALLLGAVVAGLLVPPLLGRVVDVVLEGGPVRSLVVATVALLGAVLAEAALTGLAIPAVARTVEAGMAEVREGVVERGLALPLAEVERVGTGDLIARVSGDVDAVSDASREALPVLLAAALTVGLTLVGLGVLDWRLALAGLVVVPVHVLATRWYLRRSGPVYASERRALGARTQRLEESLAAADPLRALGLGRRHLGLAAEASAAAVEKSLVAARLRSRFFACLNVAELIGLASVLATGFWLVRADVISVGVATAAALYFQRLFNPFNELLGLLDTAQDTAAAFARLVGVLLVPAPDRVALGAVNGSGVEVDDVRFAYPGGPPALRGIDLAVAPGSRVALLGGSGAGKSTLAALVAGLHAPSEGRVRVAGHDAGELARAPDARVVGLITQDVHVFAGTLADDLRLAAPDASDVQLEAALRAVGAGWATDLPDGLSTAVGEGGRELGPVEAQQVALARLLLADPAVAVLDEATAEAGSAGARTLDAAAAAALRGRTSLVIAHRLPQALDADEIVVMVDGRVAERGSHAELLEADGPYARLWAAWQGARSR